MAIISYKERIQQLYPIRPFSVCVLDRRW